MTKDDIIRMAREAAAKHGHTFRDVPQTETIEFLEAFFLLASEAEREACAKLIEAYPYWLGTVAKQEIAAAIRAGGTGHERRTLRLQAAPPT